MSNLESALQSISDYTESLIIPKPTPLQANLNNRNAALREFWQTSEGMMWAETIRQQVKDEMNTPELQAWWEDFNRRFPVCQNPV